MMITEPQKIDRKSETAPWKFDLVDYSPKLLLSWSHYPISQTPSVICEAIFKEPLINADKHRWVVIAIEHGWHG